MKIWGSFLTVVVVLAGARQLLRHQLHEPAPERTAAAASPSSATSSARVASASGARYLRSGGRAILVAPGTGDIVLADDESAEWMLGQGYQPASRADVAAHNRAELAGR